MSIGMDSFVAAKITAGQRRIQQLWSELVTIGNVTLNALIGQETLAQDFTGLGLEDAVLMDISVVAGDLNAAPAIGTPVVARGRAWRVFNVRPTQTTYEIVLKSPKK
jgi:hypothetical protein